MAILDRPSDLWTPPNLLAYLRLVLVVPVVLLVLQPGAAGWWGFGIFVFAAITDKVDGWLAKRNDRRWATRWGALIDPLIDKALTLSVLVAITLRAETIRPYVIAALGTIVAREIFVGMIKARQPITSAAEAGRFSMVAQSVAVACLALPSLFSWQAGAALYVLCIAVGASLTSGVFYFREYFEAGWYTPKELAKQTVGGASLAALLGIAGIAAALMLGGTSLQTDGSFLVNDAATVAAVLSGLSFGVAGTASWTLLRPR